MTVAILASCEDKAQLNTHGLSVFDCCHSGCVCCLAIFLDILYTFLVFELVLAVV